jgi:hypothetical protein
VRGFSVTSWSLFTSRKATVPLLQEVGWAPWPVWTGAKNLDSTGIRFPDRPARSQSLYRLRYPDYNIVSRKKEKIHACILSLLHIVCPCLSHPHCFGKERTDKIYTECPRRNVPNFGRVFLMLKYTDITQNTYIQS